jgi:hypothetical protein
VASCLEHLVAQSAQLTGYGQQRRGGASATVSHATSFQLPRKLGDNVPLTRIGSLPESLGEEDFDVGFGWPRRDDWSRTYVNSGGVFRT